MLLLWDVLREVKVGGLLAGEGGVMRARLERLRAALASIVIISTGEVDLVLRNR